MIPGVNRERWFGAGLRLYDTSPVTEFRWYWVQTKTRNNKILRGMLEENICKNM